MSEFLGEDLELVCERNSVRAISEQNHFKDSYENAQNQYIEKQDYV